MIYKHRELNIEQHEPLKIPGDFFFQTPLGTDHLT